VNQLTKTGVFAGVAVLAIVLAVVASMPRRFGDVGDGASELLFKDFQDPTLARSMQIVKFDEETSTRHEFKVARITDDKGRELWVITSHDNYPADANTQLAGVASALIDKQRGPQISSDPTQHGAYGVLDPSDDDNAGKNGIGTLVVFEGENEKKLAELIVGNEVKDQSELRYVRIRGKDPVYRVELDASKFSTKFDEWIERDLLKLASARVKEVMIRDLDLREDGRFDTTGLLQFRHDSQATENQWDLVEPKLAPGEKLEQAKVNDMRSAIADLKIVDVHRKPAALADVLAGRDERQHDPAEQRMVRESLERRGFFIGRVGGIIPSDGFVSVQMEDGLEYTLLFGGLASLTADQTQANRKKGEKTDASKTEDGEDDAKKDDAKADDAKKDDAGEKKDKATGSNRYVFVDVRLDEDFVKKPELKPIPGEPFLPTGKAAEKAKDAENDNAKNDAKDDDAEAKPAAKPKKVTLSDSVKELRRLQDEGLIDQTEWEHQRKEAEKANESAQKQYEDDLKAARKKEKELKERFADWYYVIDDEVYRKIRLKRVDVVKAPEKAPDEKAKDEKAKDEKAKDEKDAKSKSETGKPGKSQDGGAKKAT
jgi:hypothetical protein